MIKVLKFALAALLALSFVSCNDEKSTAALERKGTLQLFATDASADLANIAAARVTVDEISLRGASGAFVTVMTRQVTLDLLTLRNGLVETLSETDIPAGSYDQIRLKISSAAFELKDGSTKPLKVPSGASADLKLSVSPAVVITTGLSTDVLLDFDLSRSFVATANGYNFKPVIRAQQLAFAGTLSGEVLDVIDEGPVENAVVTVKSQTGTVTTALTDADGFFKILGLPAGTYNVVAEAPGFGNLTIEAVPITAGNEVTTHFILTPTTAVLE
jgi:hypothetical protein